MKQFNEQLASNFAEEWVKTANKMVRGFEILSNSEQIDAEPTSKELVFQEDKMKVFHYKGRGPKRCPVPLLICYALVNRQYMMDLQPDRSLIKRLINLGMDIYIIDWGYPGKSDKFIQFDDYIDTYLSDAVDFVRESTGVPAINLLGVCQGGTMAVIFSALYPEKIRNLITMVAPIDFSVDDGLLNVWSRYLNPDLVEDSIGNIPGDLLNFGFLMLKPFSLMLDKYVGFLKDLDDPKSVQSFLRMERWIFDSPDQAGAAWKKFLKELYQENRLIKGKLLINGTKVNLRKVTHPVLNIFADKDHLVPPSSSIPLEKYVGSRDVTTTAFPVGHIGIYVSSKTQKDLPPLISDWVWQRSA